MATSLGKLAGLLECAVCFETFSSPRMLPCQHVFCLRCLASLPKKTMGRLNCPCCRREVHLPPTGEEGLPPSYLVNQLLESVGQVGGDEPKCEDCDDGVAVSAGYCTECKNHLCEDCVALHRRVKALKQHQVITLAELTQRKTDNPASMRPTRTCGAHPTRQLEFYCDTHDTPVCQECLLLDHLSCARRSLADAFEEKMAPVQALLAELSQLKEPLDSAMKDLDKQSQHVTSLADMAKQTNDVLFAEYSQVLSERKEKLEKEIDHQLTESKQSVAEVRKATADDLAMLEQSLDKANALISTGGLVQLMEGRGEIMEELAQVKAAVGETKTMPASYISVSQGSDLSSQISEVGRVSSNAVDSLVEIVSAPKVVFCGVPAHIEVSVNLERIFDCPPLMKSLSGPLVEIRSSSGPAQPKVQIKDEEDGHRRLVTVTTRCEGQHDIYLFAEGSASLGPKRCSFISRSVPSKSTSPRMIIDGGGLQRSYSVAVDDRREQLYVSELCDGSSEARLMAFSMSGDFLRDIYKNCSVTVSGLAVHPTGLLLLSLFQSNQVITLDPDSLKEAIVAEPGKADGLVLGPEQISVLPSGDFLVAEKLNSRVQCISISGEHRWSYSGSYQDVVGVGLLSDSVLLTCDWKTMRVDWLSLDEQFRVIGETSPLPSSHRWQLPARVARHPSGCAIVTEPNGKRVTVLSPDGRIVSHFGREGKHGRHGEMCWPVGVACDSKGLIYVCDAFNHSLLVF